MRLAALLVAAVLAASCTDEPSRARGAEPSDAGDDADTADASDASDAADADSGSPSGGFELASFPGGFDDALSLPPRFAPLLPLTGSELTREPPGMYDSSSDQYFSYVVLWWLTGAPELGTTALRDDLFIYYTGLCGSATVTLDEPLAPGPNDAGTGLSRTGTLAVEYCFNAAVPSARVQVTTFDCPDHDAVLVEVSPAGEASAVWRDLETIRASFRCW